MKKNILITVLIFLFLAFSGCSFNKKSTMKQLKNKTDSIESMRLPDKIASDNTQNQDKNIDIIDQKKLKQIKKNLTSQHLFKRLLLRYFIKKLELHFTNLKIKTI